MNIEQQLITKTYYRSLIEDKEDIHPIQALGELFLEEEKKEIPDASFIRYSQGEVYFHNKDYEAAIYKWENVHNELEQWARKNIADAYMELELFKNAEDIYHSIQTDSLVLKIEVLLQLFSLYIQTENHENADKTIKQAVALHPDYPNVTRLARTFFEQQKDWESALNLAVQEGIRKEDTKWIEIVKNYIRRGFVKEVPISSFFDLLAVAYRLDTNLFEQVVMSLWNHFEAKEKMESWLPQLNSFLKDVEYDKEHQWMELPHLYKKTYEQLMSGSYPMVTLRKVVPEFLHVWLKFVDKNHEVFPSSAIFAWNEIVPNRISSDALKLAEQLLFQAVHKVDILEESKKLKNAILKWTENHNLNKNCRLLYLSDQTLEFNKQYIGVVSLHSGSKANFINHFLADEILEAEKTAIHCFFNYHHDLIVKQYTNEDNQVVYDGEEYLSSINLSKNIPGTVIDVTLPNDWMKKYQMSLINIPDLTFMPALSPELEETLHATDSLVFVLNVRAGLTEIEYRWAKIIQKEFPHLSIYFCVYNNGEGKAENETDMYDKLNTAIEKGELTGEIIAYEDSQDARHKLARRLHTNWQKNKNINRRKLNYLYMLERLIKDLFDQRTKLEKQLQDKIHWSEDTASRMKGAINQLEDMETEKIQMIEKSFALVKEETNKEILEEIPKLLKECSKLVTKDRDFGKIHEQLNDEMNEKIRHYLNDRVIPKFTERMKDWASLAEEELKNSEQFIDEIVEGFNTMFQAQKLELRCDFRVLDDWRRDIDRFTSNVPYEPINILLRYTPSQIFLKGAGKVLNLLTNKEMLASRYQQFVENENYEQIAEEVVDQFLTPYKLMEQGIARDVKFFFKDAFKGLNALVSETEKDIEEKRAQLKELKENPQVFRDPLNIFEITRLQYRYILEIEEMNQTVEMNKL